MAVDLTQLNFASGENYMKLYDSGTATETVPVYAGGSLDTYTLATHSLGYHPVFRVNILDSTNDSYKSHGFHQGIPPNEVVIVRAYTTTSQLKVEVVNNDVSSRTVDFDWRIYIDES